MSSALPVFGIVGCGRMGSALARMFLSRGFPVLVTSRTRRSAAEFARRDPGAVVGPLEWVAARADIVVLATPIEAACTEIAPVIRRLTQGKPVVDVSNPGFAAGMDSGPSGAEQIAQALPGSHVVKALNCVAARRLVELSRGETPVTVPIAGDDAEAKRQVAEALARIGFDTADAGPLSSSRWIESLTHLLSHLGTHSAGGDAVGFRLVRPVPEETATSDLLPGR